MVRVVMVLSRCRLHCPILNSFTSRVSLLVVVTRQRQVFFLCSKFRDYRKKRMPDQVPLRPKREHQRLWQVSWTAFLHRSMLYQLSTQTFIWGSKLLGYSGLGPLLSSSKSPVNKGQSIWERKPCSQTARKSDIRTSIHQWLCGGEYDCAVVDTTKHRQIQLGTGKTYKLSLVKKHPVTETSALSITQKRLHPNRE